MSVIIIMGIMYGLMPTLLSNVYYSSELTGFILIHVIVKYVKLYLNKHGNDIKLNCCMLILSSACLVLMVLGTEYIGGFITVLHNQLEHWNKFYNPVIIMIAISIFLLFKQVRFTNKAINYLSSLSFLVYIIHCNYFMQYYTIGRLYEWISGAFPKQLPELFYVVCVGFVLILYGFISAILYNILLENRVRKVCNSICNTFEPMAKQMIRVMTKYK